MAKRKQTKLPEAVDEQYQLVGWTGGDTQAFGRWGVVSLPALTLKKAEILVKAGFPKLQKKPKKKATETTD